MNRRPALAWSLSKSASASNEAQRGVSCDAVHREPARPQRIIWAVDFGDVASGLVQQRNSQIKRLVRSDLDADSGAV